VLTKSRFLAVAAIFAVGCFLDYAALVWGWHPFGRAVSGLGFFYSDGFEGELRPYWLGHAFGFAALAIPALGAVLALIGMSGSFRVGARPAVAPALRAVTAAWVAIGLLTPLLIFLPGDSYRQSTLEFIEAHASPFVPVWWLLHFVPARLLKLEGKRLVFPGTAFVILAAASTAALRVFAGP
jgi:hypothetical protein